MVVAQSESQVAGKCGSLNFRSLFLLFHIRFSRVGWGKMNTWDKMNIWGKMNIIEIKCASSKLIIAMRIVISGLIVAITPSSDHGISFEK